MRQGLLGMIATPACGHTVRAGVDWIADNSVFAGHYPGDQRYLAWLRKRAHHAGRCALATAPDVVGDAAATLARSAPMLPAIRALGYPVALVAQDGLEHLTVPWTSIDALFLGGSTSWKLGPAAADLAAQARHQRRHVHVGRVNSLRRLRYAASIGADSADGTYLAYGPDRNLPTLLGWLRTVAQESTDAPDVQDRSIPAVRVNADARLPTDVVNGLPDIT
ncbi:MAG TPA: hypothetical protein VF755_25905 [Catenuloplanes sp.]|jgi:hypothetical protein